MEHSINCKENYLGLEMPMCSFVSLASLLQEMPLNKAPGPDCISAEHLLYADESLRFFLSELFNICIVHGYIPNSCLNTTIVPISKNKIVLYCIALSNVVTSTRKSLEFKHASQ